MRIHADADADKMIYMNTVDVLVLVLDVCGDFMRLLLLNGAAAPQLTMSICECNTAHTHSTDTHAEQSKTKQQK